MNATEIQKYQSTFDILECWVNDMVPGGVSSGKPAMQFTEVAFNHYLATHGLPQTANDARIMFEWAAAFEFTFKSISAME